ncbi:MAG: hypothetical protein LBQ08_00245 [Holosporaceae bacterium]|nr:hypothetical protein [Holosporaceae bacterium]
MATPANDHQNNIMPNSLSLKMILRLEKINFSFCGGKIRDGIFENDIAESVAARDIEGSKSLCNGFFLSEI